MDQNKEVKAYWERAACGEELYLDSFSRSAFIREENARYALEPFIDSFADFSKFAGKKVLEVGLGTGIDHKKFCEAGCLCTGIDITERSVEITQSRLNEFDLNSFLVVGDCESLPFESEVFDHVYSCGVIHHTSDIKTAVGEIYRVLKVGGTANLMIYNKWSLVGFYLWIRYALAPGKPWLSLKTIYANYMESPGTKAFSIKEAKILFKRFRSVNGQTVLSKHDLLTSDAGQRHRGLALSAAKKLIPRKMIKKIFRNNGLYLLISCIK